MEVFAFTPCDSEYTVVEGYKCSFYDTELDNPYNVENIDSKFSRCLEIDMDSYELREDENWIKIKYESIKIGEPKRL